MVPVGAAKELVAKYSDCRLQHIEKAAEKNERSHGIVSTICIRKPSWHKGRQHWRSEESNNDPPPGRHSYALPVGGRQYAPER
jgi:hypothetical protein